ncbi:hypothetical protein DFS33DRAFT_1385830 [Desarmillaria ectypa]|nr:hypothetical protein DFS33DRAFT_1385830 [Desarmillaria ectypa]
MSSPTTPQVNLLIPLGVEGNNTSINLTIPIRVIDNITTKPAAWLLYVGFTVCGAKGYLSDKMGNSVDSLITVADLAGCTFTFSPTEPLRLIDPESFNDRTSVGSDKATRDRKFKASLIQRDGGRCVLLEPPQVPDACQLGYTPKEEEETIADIQLVSAEGVHLVPHSKGNAQSTSRRNPVYTLEEAPEITSIDDPRNGLMFDHGLHKAGMPSLWFGFLKVPNTFMRVDDVKIHSHDEAKRGSAPMEIHFHVLNSKLNFHRAYSGPWVPSSLWDFSYGVAATLNWGRQSLKDLADLTRNVYYGDGSDPDCRPRAEDTDDTSDSEDDEPAVKLSLAKSQAYHLVSHLWNASYQESVKRRVAKWVELGETHGSGQSV